MGKIDATFFLVAGIVGAFGAYRWGRWAWPVAWAIVALWALLVLVGVIVDT